MNRLTPIQSMVTDRRAIKPDSTAKCDLKLGVPTQQEDLKTDQEIGKKSSIGAALITSSPLRWGSTQAHQSLKWLVSR